MFNRGEEKGIENEAYKMGAVTAWLPVPPE